MDVMSFLIRPKKKMLLLAIHRNENVQFDSIGLLLNNNISKGENK